MPYAIEQKPPGTSGCAVSSWVADGEGAESAMNDRRTVFYTALYHASVHPSTFSDANGEYLGFDGRVHHTDRTQYHNIPAWDFYRSWRRCWQSQPPTLRAIFRIARQRRPAGSRRRYAPLGSRRHRLMRHVRRWQLQTSGDQLCFWRRELRCARRLGRNDPGATQLGTTSAGCPVRDGPADYLELGYVSTATWGSVSKTLEYATSDFSIAQLAKSLGDTANYKAFLIAHRAGEPDEQQLHRATPAGREFRPRRRP